LTHFSGWNAFARFKRADRFVDCCAFFRRWAIRVLCLQLCELFENLSTFLRCQFRQLFQDLFNAHRGGFILNDATAGCEGFRVTRRAHPGPFEWRPPVLSLFTGSKRVGRKNLLNLLRDIAIHAN